MTTKMTTKKHKLDEIYKKAFKKSIDFGKPKLKILSKNIYKLSGYDEEGYFYSEIFTIVNGRKKIIRGEHQSGDTWGLIAD